LLDTVKENLQVTQKIKRIIPEFQKEEGIRDSYCFPVLLNSAVYIFSRSEGSLFQSKPLINPTVKEIKMLLNTKQGYLEVVQSESKMNPPLEDHHVIPPGLYRFWLVCNEEKKENWLNLSNKNLGNYSLKKFSNMPSSFNPLQAFKGVKASQYNFYPTPLERKQVTHFDDQKFTLLHLCIRIRYLITQSGKKSEDFYKSLIDYDGKCFICGSSTYENLFCNNHNDEKCLNLYNEAKKIGNLIKSRHIVEDENTHVVLLPSRSLLEFVRPTAYGTEKEKFRYFEPQPITKEITSLQKKQQQLMSQLL